MGGVEEEEVAGEPLGVLEVPLLLEEDKRCLCLDPSAICCQLDDPRVRRDNPIAGGDDPMAGRDGPIALRNR